MLHLSQITIVQHESLKIFIVTLGSVFIFFFFVSCFLWLNECQFKKFYLLLFFLRFWRLYFTIYQSQKSPQTLSFFRDSMYHFMTMKIFYKMKLISTYSSQYFLVIFIFFNLKNIITEIIDSSIKKQGMGYISLIRNRKPKLQIFFFSFCSLLINLNTSFEAYSIDLLLWKLVKLIET
jgi:hypothetical protein